MGRTANRHCETSVRWIRMHADKTAWFLVGHRVTTHETAAVRRRLVKRTNARCRVAEMQRDDPVFMALVVGYEEEGAEMEHYTAISLSTPRSR